MQFMMHALCVDTWIQCTIQPIMRMLNVCTCAYLTCVWIGVRVRVNVYKRTCVDFYMRRQVICVDMHMDKYIYIYIYI